MAVPHVVEGRNEIVTNAISTTINLKQQHFTIPLVTIAVQGENVNAFITSISTKNVTVEYSALFTGRLHLQAISVK
ncbi:MAG: hypothetical protein H8E12_19730 [Rhodobacteraceae bacterium]|nr:hypothetical protein [Paracoccaceae bacterium]